MGLIDSNSFGLAVGWLHFKIALKEIKHLYYFLLFKFYFFALLLISGLQNIFTTSWDPFVCCQFCNLSRLQISLLCRFVA